MFFMPHVASALLLYATSDAPHLQVAFSCCCWFPWRVEDAGSLKGRDLSSRAERRGWLSSLFFPPTPTVVHL